VALAHYHALSAQGPESKRVELLLPSAAPRAGEPGDHVLPINLASALQLAGVRPLDIEVAIQRMRLAGADLDRAKALWLPTILLGADYFRHDGQFQDATGNILNGSKSTFMVGAGPSAIFALSDAIFEPLAVRQVVRAREASFQAAKNDSLLAVAEAYFTVQQALGELAAADDVRNRAADLVRRTEPLVQLTSPVEVVRAKVERDRRLQVFAAARERWLTASADLARILRMEPSTILQPLEPPHLQVTLIEPGPGVDDLIPVALMNRPELASQQALVQATLQRIKQERLRPLIPSVVLRGASTNPAGTLGGGLFGGGINGSMSNFNARSDIDVQVIWEWQNLGFGNRARVEGRRAENQLAVLELFRLQDRIAAEVVQAQAQVDSARVRAGQAESELKNALDSANKNLEGMAQTKAAGNLTILVFRPQEVIASQQALAQAYQDYYGAIADYNRSQFRLYHALGHPAHLVRAGALPCVDAAQAPIHASLSGVAHTAGALTTGRLPLFALRPPS
jgi:outer membrane protein TolC